MQNDMYNNQVGASGRNDPGSNSLLSSTFATKIGIFEIAKKVPFSFGFIKNSIYSFACILNIILKFLK